MTLTEGAAVVAAIASTATFVVAGLSYLRTNATGRANRTSQLIERYQALDFKYARNWVHTELQAYMTRHKIDASGGFKKLDTGEMVEWVNDFGANAQRKPSSIAREVGDFYEMVSRELKKNLVDRGTIVQLMGDDIVMTWEAMAPFIRKIQNRGYGMSRHSYFEEMAATIAKNQTTKRRVREIQESWG